MSRRYPALTDADLARYQGQLPQAHATRRRRPSPRLGAHRPPLSRVDPTETGYVLTYVDWLPTMNNHQVHRYARFRLAQRTRQIFGDIGRQYCTPRFARVEVVRVLGPRQQAMDRDSLAALAAGLIDGLQPLYLWDDSERYADIHYTNCRTRRADGPMLLITIAYEESPP